MVGTNFMDEIECGNFFDHIEDLLDFPSDELDTDLVGANGDYHNFPSIFPGSSSDALLNADFVFSGNSASNLSNSASDLSAELSVPYEDIVQLEWLSNFVEDSFSGGGMTMEKSNFSSTKDSPQNQFQTSSPVSVLESSSSCSNGKTIPISHEKRARSKRPRPATFNPRPAVQIISPTSSLTDTPQESVFVPCASSESGTNSAESRTSKKPPKPVPGEQPKKKKKIKIVPPSNPAEGNQNQNPNPNPNAAPQAVRKCMHCEITKTPQWRAGPMGPKTLCNACGVRYKSGRLFPEYRPAASPTFIPSVHSNSHKKVLEMRNKCCPDDPVAFIDIANSTSNALVLAATSEQPELIPRSNLLPASI